MKRHFILFIFSLLIHLTYGQDYEKYDILIQKADSFFQVGDFLSSANTYTSAFQTLKWKAESEDRYSAASAWALAGVPDSAFYHLNYLTNRGYLVDPVQIEQDRKLISLHRDGRWSDLINNIKKHADKLNIPLVNQLDSILYNDQKYRIEFDSMKTKYGNGSMELSNFIREMIEHDSVNLVKVKLILDKYGWLGAEELGRDGNSTLFLVIQHADLQTQEKYLPMMKDAVKNGRASPSDLALLVDRIEMKNNRPQIYGTQVIVDTNGQPSLYKTIDDKNLNKRRKEVGLGSIEEYTLSFGFEFKPTLK